MKKFLVAPVLVLAALTLAVVPAILAQAPPSQPITIKDPAEFNAYQNATTQTDPKAKAAAIEAFLTQYPQSVVKNSMISDLVDAYTQSQPQDPAKIVDAAQRLLQVDPNNLKAMYLVAVMKQQQAQSNAAQMPQLMDDAAAMATKGLAATKPADVKDDVFKTQQDAIFPLFYSIISRDALAKKDLPGAITAFRAELEYLAKNKPDATKTSPWWNDTFFLGQTYTQLPAPLDPKDLINGIWFLARAESFAPNPTAKSGIEKLAKYWYKRYHGKEDGYEDVLAKSALTIFPPADFTIAPAPTPKDIADGVVTSTSDLSTLALADKEYILANASHDNAEKLWALLKDKVTELPGTVIAATASQIQVAVTDDAKADKKADFTVNLKTPLADKDIPAVGSETNVDSATETKALVGTFDSYTQAPSAMITMRDGEITVTTKKTAPHKPTPAHHTAAH